MVFSHVWDEERDGRFLIYNKVGGVISSSLRGDIFSEFWHGFTNHRSEIELEYTDTYIFTVGKAELPELRGAEYAINVEPEGFAVIAKNRKGLLHGFMTLLDMIHPTDDEGAVAFLKCGVIRELPRIGIRMVHFCVFPETNLYMLKRFLRFAAALKYTHVIVEFWGMIKLDCLKELAWPFAFSKDEVRPIMDEARELGLEIVPMFNHWGHAALSRAIHGKHVVLDQNPTLVTLFEEGGWCWKISDIRVRALISKIRKELIDLCGEGEYFHIGCDEADGYDLTDPRLRDDACNYLNSVAEELLAMGRRPIMWGDMLLYSHPHYNGENRYTCLNPSAECEKYFFSKIDKRIIIADWQYLSAIEPVETSLTVKSYGHECLVCPFDLGVPRTVATINTAASHGLMGYIHTTWHRLSIGMPFVAMAAEGGYAEFISDHNRLKSHAEIATADMLRKVLPSDGIYERAGWSTKQVGAFIT